MSNHLKKISLKPLNLRDRLSNLFGRKTSAGLSDNMSTTSAAAINTMDTSESDTLSIHPHPLTSNPREAWNLLKNTNIVERVTPMDPNEPIYPDKVRFVCLSDTHSLTHRMTHPIPPGDVFIHAGDFSNEGSVNDVKGFNEFLGSLPHPHKIVIAGNHELSFDPLTVRARGITGFTCKPQEMLTNCTYLEDTGVQVYGLKIYGSPWQPTFCDWAFNLTRGEDCLKKWNLIPTDTDILITHGPPIGHGDLCNHGDRAGCVELLETIQKRVRPKVHIFGHIHEDYGITTNGTTMFINASTCTNRYHPTNPPIIFDIPLPPGMIK